MKKPKTKWRRGGDYIRSIAAFHGAKNAGAMVYVRNRFRGRPITIAWVANMLFSQVLGMIESGCIELADHTSEYSDWLLEQEIPF